MTTSKMPPVSTTEEWKTALAEQAKLEDELQAQIKRVAAARRRLPMAPVEGDYTLHGPDGPQSFAEVFGDATQLVIYHFMFAPEWNKGCPHCTMYARSQGPDINKELNRRDARYILTSRAPYEKLAAWAEEQNIQIPWYSAPTEFSEEMGVINDSFGDYPGINVFIKGEDGKVYRTNKASVAGIESTMPGIGLMHLLPWGMQEKGEDSPEGFPQRFEPIG